MNNEDEIIEEQQDVDVGAEFVDEQEIEQEITLDHEGNGDAPDEDSDNDMEERPPHEEVELEVFEDDAIQGSF